MRVLLQTDSFFLVAFESIIFLERSSLLSELNLDKIKDLTPKAKRLYQRAIQFKRQAERWPVDKKKTSND